VNKKKTERIENNNKRRSPACSTLATMPRTTDDWDRKRLGSPQCGKGEEGVIRGGERKKSWESAEHRKQKVRTKKTMAHVRGGGTEEEKKRTSDGCIQGEHRSDLKITKKGGG